MTSKLKDKIKKENFQDPIEIEGNQIFPGQDLEVKIPVAKMPSDTRLYMHTFIYRSVNKGPTVLILAGIHGDEINGIEIASQLNFDKIFKNLKCGNVIVLPLVNVFGFNNFSRDVPDGKDVNRSFPGSSTGSLASRVAYIITKTLLPHCDYAIDLHTGGASRYNYPQVRYSSKVEGCTELAEAFNAPLMIDLPLIPNSLRRVAKDQNVKAIVYEGGESERLDNLAISCGKSGILKVLSHFGMIDLGMLESKNKTTKISETFWQRSSKSGIFIWCKSSGDLVKKGEVMGIIKDPYGYNKIEIKSKYSGIIIGHNNASIVNQGDALFHIGKDQNETSF